ncbi:hypothetical protein [Amycolatopsis sp. NPDC051102]|uniref:hypothetical protein n=1 Tax=Amycolatopsis sp. NPDC051102 TaxID=3155163 RepID=UPI003439917B
MHKLFPDLGGAAPGTVALHVWSPPDLGGPTGRVQVRSQPAGLTCATGSGGCRASFGSGTRVALTAVISPALQESRPLVWVGCGNRSPATQPCTLLLSSDTSVCVAPADASWTVEVCRQRAGG